jgi:hemerythrin-like metal-binding protein
MKASLEIIPWDKKYEIGHELIDSQHRIFLMLLNKLVDTLAKGVNKEHLFRVVNELRKYAEFHFISEESVMHEYFYPGTKNHEQIHARILGEVSVLCEHVSQDQAGPEDIVLYLQNWLFNHISLEDSHIAQYITEKGSYKISNTPDFIKWDPSYEIGHELIDSQHRVFVMILNKFARTIRDGSTDEHILFTLNELKKYAEFHFISEENLMDECHYPDLINHEKIHSKIIAELSILADRLANHYVQPIELVNFLRRWLFDHILNEDSHIAQHIRNRMA